MDRSLKSLVISAVLMLLTPFSLNAGWEVQNSGTDAFLGSVFFLDEQEGWASGSWGTVLHTVDGGENWVEQSVPVAYSVGNLFFMNDQEGWATYSAGLLHTVDGGVNWTTVDPGVSTGLSGIHFTDPDTGWISGGKNTYPGGAERAVIGTDDGGASWDVLLFQEQELPLSDVFFTDSQHGCVIGQVGAVLTTSDGGQNWTDRSVPDTGNLNELHFTSPDTGFIAGENGVILRTLDGGESWSEMTTGTTDYLGSICFADNLEGWAVGGGNENCTILHTDDGGATWEEQSCTIGHLMSSVFFTDDQNGWSVGPYGVIIHTENGGAGTGIGPEAGDDTYICITGAYPNPFSSSVLITISSPGRSDVRAAVYGLSGRIVDELLITDDPEGTAMAIWDGRTGDGSNAPAGLYLVRTENEIGSDVSLVTLVR